MKTLITIALCCFYALSYAMPRGLLNEKPSLHRQSLKTGFDTSYWREIWPDDIWHIRCVFADIDGDGMEEMLAITTSEEDRMGDYWKVWKQDDTGKYKQVFLAGEISFCCHEDSFFCMRRRNGAAVIGLGMEAGYVSKSNSRMDKLEPDCSLAFAVGGKFVLNVIRPDVDNCFRDEDVVSIERLYPEWYFGYEFKSPPDDTHSPYTTWCGYSKPKGDLRRGGVEQPKDFDAFASEYRRDVKMRIGVKEKITVYAVFLDADNDGDADCYVSSSVESDGSGKYSWTLYLRGEGGYSKAKVAVHPVRDKNCKNELKPKAIGRRDSFCRLVRFDIDPTFMLLDEEKSTSAVRDAITNILSHRIEKLECASFHE